MLARRKEDRARALVSPKTKLKQEAQDRLFKDAFGANTRFNSIDRDKARELLEILTRLPPNWTKRFPQMSARDVAKLDVSKVGKPMSATTANSYLAAFSSLLEFGVKEHILNRNPALNLRIASAEPERKRKRLPFSRDDLEKIFKAPLFTGCLDDEHGYAKVGPNQPRRGRFWIPLISLFSGMRLNEICQLTEDDVVSADGVPIIFIRSDEEQKKRVKTKASERFVPVHPELISVGFLDHVVAVRKNASSGSRLFPELRPASSGYLSDNFSKWFARFLDSVDVKDQRKNFHSFRHTYRDALREADISVERVRVLGGWASGRTEDNYGAGLKPSTLASEIAKIDYPGLDLRHLHRRRRDATG